MNSHQDTSLNGHRRIPKRVQPLWTTRRPLNLKRQAPYNLPNHSIRHLRLGWTLMISRLVSRQSKRSAIVLIDSFYFSSIIVFHNPRVYPHSHRHTEIKVDAALLLRSYRTVLLFAVCAFATSNRSWSFVRYIYDMLSIFLQPGVSPTVREKRKETTQALAQSIPVRCLCIESIITISFYVDFAR